MTDLNCFAAVGDEPSSIELVAKAALAEIAGRDAALGACIEAANFRGEPGELLLAPGPEGRARVLASPPEGNRIWALAGLPLKLPEGVYAAPRGLDAQAFDDMALGWALGAYSFDRYKAPKRASARLILSDDDQRQRVEKLAGAIYLARDLINTPAEDMGPEELEAAAVAVAAQHGAQHDVVVGAKLLERNYPLIHAVGRASPRLPRLIDIRWGDEKAPKVSLVGKGVCFDSGGLNIKNAAGMFEMKVDMGGAAILLGLADALMAAAAPIRLRLLIPAVDNSIAGNAIRPRDIVRSRLGKTVEIGNTDAEGRLILADALAEASSESPDLLIDCASLTGAAGMALGPEIQALFSNDDQLANQLLEASILVDDPLWRMPLWAPYRKSMEGVISDLSSTGKLGSAGAITAALFLSEFVSNDTKWVHLDLRPANASARPGRPEGGEASALRVLYSLICARYGRIQARD